MEHFCITSGAAIFQMLLRSCHVRALCHHLCSICPSHFPQNCSFSITFASLPAQLSCRVRSEAIISDNFFISSGADILQILRRSDHFGALLHHFWSSYPSDFAQKLSFRSTLSSPLQQLSFRVCSEVVILDQSCITSGADILQILLRSDHFGSLFITSGAAIL